MEGSCRNTNSGEWGWSSSAGKGGNGSLGIILVGSDGSVGLGRVCNSR